MITLLDKAIAKKLELGCEDRYTALVDIQISIDQTSLWMFAKNYGLLVNESAEEFAMQFMAAYNKEVRPYY